MSWSRKRETTCKEDIAYSLLGIFDIKMPLIYGEGREKALRRLREEIDKASKGCSSSLSSLVLIVRKLLTRAGMKREDFSVSFSLSNISYIEHFVVRERN
jgi:hypothetical protein